jgi:hypothetical protein
LRRAFRKTRAFDCGSAYPGIGRRARKVTATPVPHLRDGRVNKASYASAAPEIGADVKFGLLAVDARLPRQAERRLPLPDSEIHSLGVAAVLGVTIAAVRQIAAACPRRYGTLPPAPHRATYAPAGAADLRIIRDDQLPSLAGTNAARISRPGRIGMFCKFGFDDDSLQ